jgi:hypothetical protein
MRTTFVGTVLGLALLLGYAPQAGAGALLKNLDRRLQRNLRQHAGDHGNQLRCRVRDGT